MSGQLLDILEEKTGVIHASQKTVVTERGMHNNDYDGGERGR